MCRLVQVCLQTASPLTALLFLETERGTENDSVLSMPQYDYGFFTFEKQHGCE